MRREQEDGIVTGTGSLGEPANGTAAPLAQATCGTVRGIPFATLGALSFQAPAPRPPWDWDSFKPPKEAPQYGVLEISSGNVTLQYTQFCDFVLGIDG